MENNPAEPQDPQEPPAVNNPPEDGGERQKPLEDAASGGRKEEEEKEEEEEEAAFLLSLHQFMRERRTPIERIPHLGFKQINLWKIYKAVEKLGAYELVTGRRLWKNVYDELGGSPGSTSAATCTRRHYERLVLPYVRHLKGEEDKPLPPSKPRKQYKGSRGGETGEKSKRAKKEKGREQVPLDKAKAAEDAAERGRAAEGSSNPLLPTPNPPAGGCPDPCRPHPETHKRLFSGFCAKGNHPIMSPLAKKKLLAQVSEAEASHRPKRHHAEGQRPGSLSGHPRSPEPTPRPATGTHRLRPRSPEPSGPRDPAPSPGSEMGPVPGSRDEQPCSQAEGPAPAVFTGCFHAYRSELLKPPGCHPLWGYFSSLRDFLEPSSSFPSSPHEEQPQDLRSKAGRPWSGESRPGPGQGRWVPPGAAFGPAASRGKCSWEEDEEDEEEDEEDEDEEEEEEQLALGAKLRAVSPMVGEGSGCPGGLAKPRAVVAGPGYAAPLPRAPDVSEGATLRFPGSLGNPLDQLKTRGVPATPALSLSPFVIPAFPSPLVAVSSPLSDPCRPLATGPGRYPESYESSLRHRLYPAGPWHCQPPYPSRQAPAFHRHAKL